MGIPSHEQIPNIASSLGPSWATFGPNGNQTILVWKGSLTDDKIYWSTTTTLNPNQASNQYSWSNSQATSFLTSGIPAVARFNGKIYLAWKGVDASAAIWFSTLNEDGGTWAPAQQLTWGKNFALTTHSPSLSSNGSRLYLAWKGGANDNRIFFCTLTAGGTWSAEGVVPNAATTLEPSLGSDGKGTMYLAWKDQAANRIWWTKSVEGAPWTANQQGPAGPMNSAPSIGVDVNAVKWLAWAGTAPVNPTVAYSFPPSSGDITPYVCFSKLVDEPTNVWTSATGHVVAQSMNRPALLSTGTVGGMVAWAGIADNDVSGLYYAPLVFAPLVVRIQVQEIFVHNMRSGHLGIKDSSDTVYLSQTLKIKGQPPSTGTGFVGNLTGGSYLTTTVPYGTIPMSGIEDTDTVYFIYSAINSSKPTATTYLQNLMTQLVEYVEKADEAAIEKYTGIDLSMLTPQEAGALLGAQIGFDLGVGLGPILGALAGWFASSIWSFAFPDCDGPVAAAIYSFKATELKRALLSSQATVAPDEVQRSYTQGDAHPGVTSASGCGSNSNYSVNWCLFGLFN
jgi:hypothetical protein